MPKITIDLSNEIIAKLETRAKKNFFSLKEQIEDIIRRSTANRQSTRRRVNVDDRLVEIFSRQKSGRKKVKKKKG